jgi:hypothetical protein
VNHKLAVRKWKPAEYLEDTFEDGFTLITLLEVLSGKARIDSRPLCCFSLLVPRAPVDLDYLLSSFLFSRFGTLLLTVTQDVVPAGQKTTKNPAFRIQKIGNNNFNFTFMKAERSSAYLRSLILTRSHRHPPREHALGGYR